MKSDGLIWLNCCWLNSQPVDGDCLPISVRVESLALFITARGKIHPQQIKTKHKKARAVFIILVIYCVLIYLLHKSQNRSSVNMELRQKQWKQPCRIVTQYTLLEPPYIWKPNLIFVGIKANTKYIVIHIWSCIVRVSVWTAPYFSQCIYN